MTTTYFVHTKDIKEVRCEEKKRGSLDVLAGTRLISEHTATSYSRAKAASCLPTLATSFVRKFMSLKFDRNRKEIESTTINFVCHMPEPRGVKVKGQIEVNFKMSWITNTVEQWCSARFQRKYVPWGALARFHQEL